MEEDERAAAAGRVLRGLVREARRGGAETRHRRSARGKGREILAEDLLRCVGALGRSGRGATACRAWRRGGGHPTALPLVAASCRAARAAARRSRSEGASRGQRRDERSVQPAAAPGAAAGEEIRAGCPARNGGGDGRVGGSARGRRVREDRASVRAAGSARNRCVRGGRSAWSWRSGTTGSTCG